MKKRITIIAATVALFTLTAASSAAAGSVFGVSGSGVLVRHDDGYIITGTVRAFEVGGDISYAVGTIHGTLIEETTGFNTCPDFYFDCTTMTGEPSAIQPTCNLLGGEVTLNFQGAQYDAQPGSTPDFRVGSSLCKKPDDPSTYQLRLFLWSTSHVPPGAFPDIFAMFNATVQQISPTVLKWSSS
jgi:hypothetical protein